jgi:signal transduction histidine kinase
VTTILIFGSYGEGSPSSPSDRIQFQGHAAPQPGPALILVAIADPTQPAPGTAQLADLIAGARRAGLQTTLSVTGDPVPLPGAVDLAAYRIIQESLTNTIRHAGPATAAVGLCYAANELRIDVTDTGRGKSAATGNGDGHGLAGMRERASAVGGTVEADPGPAGGFRVAARLPFNGTVTEQTEQEGARP